MGRVRRAIKFRLQTGSRFVTMSIKRIVTSRGYSERKLFNFFYRAARQLGYPEENAKIMAIYLTEGKKAISGKGHMLSADDITRVEKKVLERLLEARYANFKRKTKSKK
ncbi:MAG: hypothetical protein Q7S21_05285 [archaeon]|nr:hypothetical protein [archaeon]